MNTAGTTMKRRNVMHAVLWCLVAAVGVVTLVQLRQYGQAAVMRYNGYQTIESAWEEYAAGNTAEAQREVMALVRKQPQFKQEAVGTFGQHMLAMPSALQQFFPEDAESGGNMEEVVGFILAGDSAQAEQYIDTELERAELSGTLVMWRAREAMRNGDLMSAQRAYKAYWRTRARDRVSMSERLVAQESTLEERVNALLWSGLWDEAFALSASVAEAREESITLLCEGIAAELQGDEDKAKTLYERVLKQRPAHYLARLRVDALRQGTH